MAKLRHAIVLLIASAIMFTSGVTPAEADSDATVPSGFDDVDETNALLSDIRWLAETGITQGCNPPDNTSFCPEDYVTRGQIAAFLRRATEVPSDFDDGSIPPDSRHSVFADDIAWLVDKGISKGCNPPKNNRFCPDDYVTRGQMAAFLARVLRLPTGEAAFTDAGDSVFAGDIARIAAAGITKGCNPPKNTRFCPEDYVTRAQMAAFLHRGIGADRYWEWGWGLYNTDVRAEVTALFDWSLVDFGYLPRNQSTLDRLNKILALRPDHQFLVELWPIQYLGDSIDENRMQGTLFHYLYEPGIRESIHDELRNQIDFILTGLSNPESVIGFTFLEELPLHFTTGRATLGWERGENPPWDIARFEADISSELGEPFDMAEPSHRIWWGNKYSGTLSEINTVIRQAGGDREVFFWQATDFRTLDMLSGGESMLQNDVIPIHYRDIVGSGVVDGIFGFPSTERLWHSKTTKLADALDLSFWSQLSTPGPMRASTWEDTLRLVVELHSGNLGTMLYIEPSTGAGDWNPMPYEDAITHWTVEAHARMLHQLLIATD